MSNLKEVYYGLEKVETELNGTIITKYLICIKSGLTDLVLYVTDYTRYLDYSNGKTRRINSNQYKTILYVVNMLNWIFIECHEVYEISKIEDIRFSMVQDYLNHYGMVGAVEREYSPKKSSVGNVRSSITEFLIGLKIKNINEEIGTHWLRKEATNSYKKSSFDYELNVNYDDSSNIPAINRDICTEAVSLLLTCARTYMPLLEFAIIIQCFSGIREGEVCNCRGESSIYGAGIVKEHLEGRITGVTILLTKEYELRSDRVFVGHIKSKLDAMVYPAFLNEFLKAYDRHKALLAKLNIENTQPLFVNERISRKTGYHMAMTVNSYNAQFEKLMNKYVLPVMRVSKNSKLRDYAKLLDQNRYGLHWFRHWFSVQLVLAGEDWVSLMDYRRDKSELSAITYIKNKKVFQEMYHKANQEHAEFILNYNPDEIKVYEERDDESYDDASNV